jgi:POT family proton-dependent oligopeptide transporter
MDLVFAVGLAITLLTAVPVALQLRRHPRGLVILFFAEMWERFSYYGMRGLLIFYLTQHFLIDDATAQGMYGAYTSLVFFMPLIGGFLADRFLGQRKAIAFGALLLVAGHLTMAYEGRPATQTLSYGGRTYDFAAEGLAAERTVKLRLGDGLYAYGPAPGGGIAIEGLPEGAPLPSVLPAGSYSLGVKDRDETGLRIMYLALSLIIMGVGFLKANISSIVGELYPAGDHRRDPGFTLYYYGINLGALWAAIACGWLGQTFGWSAGFGAAGAGMALGFGVFVAGRRFLEGKGEPPDLAALKKRVAGPLDIERTIYVLALAGVGLVWLLIGRQTLVGWLLAAGSVLVLGYLAWFMWRRCTRVEAQRLGLALVLIAASVVFWTLFEQAGSSMNQFAERNTQLGLPFGQTMSAAQAQSFNPFFILLGAPVFAALWAWLGARGKDPNPVVKFGLALLQVGGGFFVLAWGASLHDEAWRVPLAVLALAYLLHTTGELCFSPVGLSQMTRLAAPAVISTLMAVWFLGQSWAQWIGGKVAQLTASETVGGQVLDPEAALATYRDVFQAIGLWGVGAGVLLLALSPWLKRWAHGAEKNHPAPEGHGDRMEVASKARDRA